MAYVLRTENQTILVESITTPISANVLMSEPRTFVQGETIQAWETNHATLNFFLVDNMGDMYEQVFADAVYYYNKVEVDGSKQYILTLDGGNILIFTAQSAYRKNARNARRMQDLLIFLEPDAKVFNRFILPYVTGGDGKSELKMKFNQQIETNGAVQNIEQFQIVTNIPTSFFKNIATAPNLIAPVRTTQMRGVYVYVFGAIDASAIFSTGTVIGVPNGAIPNPVMATYTTLPWAYGEI